MDEARLIERFSLDRIAKAGISFNLDKLKWFNETYIRQKSEEELLELVKIEAGNTGFGLPEDSYMLVVIRMLQERVSVVGDFLTQAPFLFATPDSYDEKMAKKRWKADSAELLTDLGQRWQALESWDASALEGAFEALLAEKEVGKGKVLAPLRLALTGAPAGPGVFDIAALVGKEETAHRLAKAIETLG